MADDEKGLKDLFIQYCNYGKKGGSETEIDNVKFFKLCKETKLLSKKIERGTIDVAFAKVKAKGARKINFAAFKRALAEIGAKRYPSKSSDEAYAAVLELLAGASGPSTNATQADYVKFHDDKSTYKGVYAHGGPSTVDTDKVNDLSQLADRDNKGDARGAIKVKDTSTNSVAPVQSEDEKAISRSPSKTSHKTKESSPSKRGSTRTASPSKRGSTRESSPSKRGSTRTASPSKRSTLTKSPSKPMAKSASKPTVAIAPSFSRPRITSSASSASRNKIDDSDSKADTSAFNDLSDIFLQYCQVGDKSNTGQMDNAKFFKLCKDANIITKTVTRGDVDVAFAKAKDKTQRKIVFKEFKSALSGIATKRFPNESSDEAIAKTAGLIKEKGGPTISGTTASYNKFHDDKSLYKGVYAHGGPSTIDRGKITDISQTLDRTPADARGVKI